MFCGFGLGEFGLGSRAGLARLRFVAFCVIVGGLALLECLESVILVGLPMSEFFDGHADGPEDGAQTNDQETA